MSKIIEEENQGKLNESKEGGEVTEKELSDYKSILSDAFSKSDTQAMVDFFEKANKEERDKMMKGAPEVVKNEKTFNEEKMKWAAQFPQFEQLLNSKLTEFGSKIDRRTLMAEAIWECQIALLSKSAPECMKDFKKTHGTFDRFRFETKHQGKEKTLVADFAAVTERANRSFMNRLALEFDIAANAHFDKDTAKAMKKDMLEKTLTVEDRLKSYTELTYEKSELEDKFNKKRSEVEKSKPAALDLFLRMYHQNSKNNTQEERAKVLEKAIAEIDKTYSQVKEKCKDKTQIPDLKEVKKVEELYELLQPKKNEDTESEKVEELNHEKIADEIVQEIVSTDREVQTALLEFHILDLKKQTERKKIVETEGKREEILGKELQRIDTLDKQKRDLKEGETIKTADHLTDMQIKEEGLIISTKDEQFGKKNIKTLSDSAKILAHIGETHLEEHGLEAGSVVTEKGEKATYEQMEYREKTLEKRIQDVLKMKVEKKAKKDSDQPLNDGDLKKISNLAAANDRKKQIHSAIDALKKAS